ncbi:MAG: DUF1822 family protein [Cyanobacteria bacterium J06621_11]
MSLDLNNPVQPTLELLPSLDLWQRCEQLLEPDARWQIYLHQLAESALIKWFEHEVAPSEIETSVVPSVQPWPTANACDVWHVVEGLALTIGASRIVVILSESIDAAELRVPQEWVDLPTWVGDYYLAAQVDVDEQRLSLWGYATHLQLKTEGAYDCDSRTYLLNDVSLVEDFSVFQAARQLVPRCRASLAALPTVSALQATNLQSRLASVPEPRLEVPFAQWGALLSDRTWRDAFYKQRQLTNRQLDTRLQQQPTRQPLARVNLGEWLHQQFDQDWQSIDNLLLRMPALQFRSTASDQTVKVRGKRISLPTATATLELVMILVFTVVSENRRNIRVLLYPASRSVLTPEISMTLEVAESGEDLIARDKLEKEKVEREKVLRQVQSGLQDDYIQLPPFVCSAAQSFIVGIALADRSIKIEFVS